MAWRSSGVHITLSMLTKTLTWAGRWAQGQLAKGPSVALNGDVGLKIHCMPNRKGSRIVLSNHHWRTVNKWRFDLCSVTSSLKFESEMTCNFMQAKFLQ